MPIAALVETVTDIRRCMEQHVRGENRQIAQTRNAANRYEVRHTRGEGVGRSGYPQFSQHYVVVRTTARAGMKGHVYMMSTWEGDTQRGAMKMQRGGIKIY